MGVVYLAFDPVLDRYSAVKVMTTSGEVDEELRARFFREARSVAKIRHPNIIAIYDMGEDQNRPYIAMEHLEGADLKALIEKKVFIPFEKKLDLIIQICRGLHYAHQHGVIHRDIKPANVFVTLDGEVRILDFGLARLESSELTRAGMVMGSPYYMSPEQVRGWHDLDGRSDLFSAAVVLYELLTYQRPFEADNLTGVCFKIVSDPHPPISQFLQGCAEELVQIIDRALSKDRDARFATGEELAEALKGFQQKIPTKLQELRPKVESIEAEFKQLESSSTHLVGMDLLQPKLFEVEESVADPIASVVSESVTTHGPLNDYGSLLLRQGSLHKRLETVNRVLVEVSALANLFEIGHQQFEKGELDACLATLEKILSVQPANAKALEMQEECRRLLQERRRPERQSNLSAVLHQALETFDQGNYEQCLQAVSRAFEFDPDNAQALQIQQQASDSLQRQKRVEEQLKVAQGHERGGDYEACLRAAIEGLALDREHKELDQLQQRAQVALTSRRHKSIRKTLVVVGPVLLVLLAVGGGLLRLAYKKESIVQSNLPSEAKSKLRSSTEPPSLPLPAPSKEDSEIARGLEAASRYLTTQEYSEAASEAAKVLERSPGNPEGERLHRQARESLDKIASANQKAKALYQAGKNEEAIVSLGEVLKLAPSNAEALQLLNQLEHFAGKGAAEAMAQLKQAKSEAEGAKALELASSQFETARGLETMAIRLYKAKQYSQATPKLFEAREAYRRAAIEAQAAAQERRLAAQRAQAQADESERQQASKRAQVEERERQQQMAALRDRVGVSQQAFEKARAKASEAGAEGKAADLFRQAIGLASEAKTKLDQGDFTVAQHNYEVASTLMERAKTSANAALEAEAKKPEPAHDAAEKGSDLRMIGEVLRSYKAAYEGKDLGALKALWPNLAESQAKKLEEYFKFARSIQVDLQPVDPPRVAGETATVTCRRVDQVVTVDGKKMKNETNTTLSLRKRGVSWTIEAIR
jgi:serine/threonine-protein kinase